MALRKMCMICENRVGLHQCVECGKIVCDDHYVHRTNMCSVCTMGVQV